MAAAGFDDFSIGRTSSKKTQAALRKLA
jgi:hypothetical protein